MRSIITLTLLIAFVGNTGSAAGQGTAQDGQAVELARTSDEYSTARLLPAEQDGQQGVAVVFDGTHDLHYYATPEAATFPDFALQVKAASAGVTFADPVMPKPSLFYDVAQEKNIEVYEGAFTIFVPFAGAVTKETDILVTISGQTCTSQVCLPPFSSSLSLSLDPASVTWQTVTIPLAAEDESDAVAPTVDWRSIWLYLLLAVVAGLSINVMPCVLPVIPLIIMKFLEQSKQAGGRRLASGMAFCGGIVGFFALFAVVAAGIQLAAGQSVNLNDIYRYPNVVIALFLFIVFFALVMLDIIPIVLPSALANKETGASSLTGSLGMGFFVGVLSIPCSGAILGSVLAWAQTQPLIIGTLVFLMIGLGMALPYALLIAMPKLMDRLPKPGTWMETFKKACGFLLFMIAAMILVAIPEKQRLVNVLLYSIIFSFCVWMWGKRVDFSTPASKKRFIRGSAVMIAIVCGVWLLPPVEVLVNWQPYDEDVIKQAQHDRQPVLMKFTADWCKNCKVVEKKVYRDPKTVALMEERNVLPIKGDTTTKKLPATVALDQIYGEGGQVPITILLLPGEEKPHKLRGIDIGDDLRSLLETLPVTSSSPEETHL